MKKNWTTEELELLGDDSLTNAKIAKQLGRTLTSVTNRRTRFRADRNTEVGGKLAGEAGIEDLPGVERPPVVVKTPESVDYWKSECKRLAKALEKERLVALRDDELFAEAEALAPRSYDPAPPVSWPEKKPGSAQSAVLLFSDQHVGQVVHADQTLGFGGYSPNVFLSRLKRLEEAVYSILQDHVTTPIDELVIPMLGDTLHGALVHSVEAGQRHTLLEQFFLASHACAQFFRNLSSLVPKIRIYTACGNHTRWQNQHRTPSDNRFSNLDMFCYVTMQALTRDISNIEWNLNKQPFAVFDVQGWAFWAGHGDTLRGGDKALGIPAHAIGRSISSTMGLRARAGQPMVNYYCSGHLHRPIQLPHTLGEFIVNGGFPGVDGYGLAEGFQAYPPCQKFFMVHPAYGRAACYDLRVDFEPKSPAPYYQIPTDFAG